ncbi:multidrug resistance efflux transporter family protein [Campylobacterota bacterium DY0563]
MSTLKNKIEKFQNEPGFLVIVGLLAAGFFSATFIINRAISLDGGHWYWSASLRFVFTVLFLSLGFVFFKGFNYYKMILNEYIQNFKFWTIAGTVGFGFFYSLICYAADFSPGWVVATTWQMTILASLFVLAMFGKKLSKKIWFFTFVIFVGVTLVNFSHIDMNNLEALFLGFFPVLIAAFSYPIGNQLVWEQKIKREEKNLDTKIFKNAFIKVFLLTLGSFPFWIILYFVTNPGVPSNGQYISVALVSLLSGVIATSLFLYARNHANTTSKLILVDATQAGEVFFALIGELIFLNAALPNATGLIGLVVTVTGLILLTKSKD